jgi:hypothetical protein
MADITSPRSAFDMSDSCLQDCYISETEQLEPLFTADDVDDPIRSLAATWLSP